MGTLKILHTADMHLGLTFIDAVMGHRASEERRLDLLSNFDLMVDRAIREKYDFFLMCGDIFHSTNPGGRTFVDFSTRIGRLSDAGVQVIAIPGNHDVPKAAPSLSMTRGLAEARAPRFYLQSDLPEKPLILQARDNRKVGFIPIPYLAPQSAVHLEEIESNQDLKERYNLFLRNLISRLLEDQRLKEVEHLIVMAHGTVSGATYGSERSFVSFEIPIWAETLLQGKVDYIAMGHIHMPQAILGGPVYYPGSIERMSFGEEGQEKAYLVLEEEKGELKPSYQPLPSRPMMSIKAANLPTTDPTAGLKKIIETANIPRGALLRMLVKIPRRVVLNIGDLESELQKKGILYHVIQTDWEMEPEIAFRRDARSIQNLIKEQLEQLDIDERVRTKALRYAEKIIGESEER
ncbi:MAG: exonuclease SbcCD subunit D [Thaumarchaeota archaeon]|nr:exonuclease SbcCD subunit D [Nitrososphaerota archaeon]MCL5316854.1 exonuclease SbcCD subunit D [Nitrososphaerota archaeon]